MSNNNSKQHSALYNALSALIEPVVNALDCTVANDEGDSGQTKPSQRDMSLRIVLGGICQNVHNQLYGEIISSNGQKLPNAKERLDESEMKVAAASDRINNDTATNADMKAFEWLRINEARYTMYQEMLSATSSLYSEVTGETWKPYVKSDNVVKTKITDEMKERVAALAAARKKNTPPAEQPAA